MKPGTTPPNSASKSDEGNGGVRRRTTTLFWIVVAGVFVWRLRECLLFPINTDDVLRHLLYGLLVWRDGLSAAAHPLRELNPSLASVAWSNLPYNYPVMALGFSAVVAGIWPSVFFFKLALTIVEGINAWLVYVFSRERWLALIYWASPLSIWWVSREAQFEPLQNLFIFGALCLLARFPFWSLFLLALAIQTKLLAVLLLPFFIFVLPLSDRDRVVRAGLGFLCGWVPSLLVQAFAFPTWNYVFRYSNPGAFNPYYWLPFVGRVFRWTPVWLIIVNEILTYGFLAFLLVSLWKSKRRVAYLAALVFMILVKFHFHIQPWYLLLLPALLLPIEDRRRRFQLILFAVFLDFYTVAELLTGAFGYVMPHYFDAITIFHSLRFPG